MRNLITLGLFGTSLLLGGCQSAYYGAMERVGYHKRDIMVSRVKDAKESQEEAQQQFSSALEEMQTLLNYPDTGGQRAPLIQRQTLLIVGINISLTYISLFPFKL
jgi:hypothetical protein